MDLRGKKLLILGGTLLSCEIIKQAKKQGAFIVVTDYLEDSPGKKIADKSFLISTTDVEAVVDLIRNEKIDGVLTGFIDLLLPYYVEICEKANIPCYATKEQIDITTNKTKFKELCRSFDVPVVEEYDIKYPFTKGDIKHLEYPVLIKPVDNSGARGVFICKNCDELIINFEKSLKFSKNKKILVERFMKDKEATIFYLVQNGEICLSSMADRHMTNVQSGVLPLPVAYTFPSKHLEKYQENLNAKVIEMFEHIGIKNGMIFIQTFVEEGNCIFYEMGYRLTGSLEYKIIEKLNNINPMEMMINYSLTGLMYEKDIKPLVNPNYKEWGVNITFLAKPGRVGKIVGIDEVKSFEGVIDIVLTYSEGDVIPESALGTLEQVIIRVFATTKTKEELSILINKVQRTIKIYSQNGQDMQLEPFDTKELFN